MERALEILGDGEMTDKESPGAIAILDRCWQAAGLLGFPSPGPYTWRQLSRLAAGRYEPFAVLACILGGKQGADDRRLQPLR